MSSTHLKKERKKQSDQYIQIQEREIRLFKLILEQKFLTAPQIVEHIFKGHKSAAAARLQKLVRAKYLVTTRPFTKEPQSYLLGRSGVETLKQEGYGVGINDPLIPGSSLPRAQKSIEVLNYEHDKKVTNVRFICENLGVAQDWQSEKFLKMGRRGDRKVPDGIFTVDGEEIAVEVELRPKHSERYRKIMASYEKRHQLHFIFYLCGTWAILKKIGMLAKDVVLKHYLFGLYDDFIRNPKRAVFITHTGRYFRLGLVLKRKDGTWPVRPVIKTPPWYFIQTDIQTFNNKPCTSAPVSS